jgi:hypothetical protein
MKRILFALALLLAWPAFADVQIKSGATSDTLTVGATSKAARVTLYDDRGSSIGQKVTYSAGTTAKTATAAGTGPFFTICGSATKTIRVQRLTVSGSVSTTAIVADLVVKRTSTATSAGTATALTAAPRDSGSGAATAALVNYYTALATAGASVGVMYTAQALLQVTGTFTTPHAFWDSQFGQSDESEAPVLRGTAQCLEASFGTTTTNAPTLSVAVVWTEE